MRESGREPRWPVSDPSILLPDVPQLAADMWGPQARAAEYKAATTASRRVSEEHQMPQKPAPVSLSVFTKNAPLNRNKGTKAWKPLVLETSPESVDDSPDDDDDDEVFSASIPTRVKSADYSNPASESSAVSKPIDNLKASVTNIGTTRSGIPIAPKAMVRIPQTPSTLANPTPKRVQPHSIINQGQHSEASSVSGSPGKLMRNGGYPVLNMYPAVPWFYDLQGRPMLVSGPVPTMPLAEPRMLPFNGQVMFPHDISPTKQENKLASLSHAYTGPPVHLYNPSGHFRSATDGFPNPFFPPMAGLYTGLESSNDSYHGNMLFANPGNRPALQHMSSNGHVEVNGRYSDASSMAMLDLARHNSYPEVVATPVKKPSTTTTPLRRTPAAQPVRVPIVSSSEAEPYDRKTRMETFVATQQALARTGKTVLHNPDLHRVKTINAASPVRAGNAETTPERASQLRNPAASTTRKPLSVNGPPFFPRPIPVEDDRKFSPIDQSTLRTVFEVDSEEWLQLKPVTPTERKRMNRVMKTFAKAQAPDVSREFREATTIDTKKENLKQWMQAANKDSRPITATRRLFEEAAEERLAKDSVTGGIGDDAVGYVLSDAEVECAGICAVGDIVASLVDDTERLSSVNDCDRSVFEYKLAPEYAIERGQLLTGNAKCASFFETSTSGFHTAPSRIARDPRFRPAAKEAPAVKQMDHWNYRPDMFSGRRM